MSRVEVLNHDKLRGFCTVVCLMIFLAEFSDIQNRFEMLRGKQQWQNSSVILLPQMIFELDV